MLKKQVLKIDDYSGGLVTKASELSTKPNQTSDCKNMHTDVFKSLQKRKGYSKVSSIAQNPGGACKGVYNYLNDESTQYMVGLWGTALKKMDVVTSAWDGNWDTISADTIKGTALTANYMHNTTFNSELVITTEGRDVPQRYDPDDDADYVDLDWESSRAYVVGDVSAVTPNPLITKSYLRITIGTVVYDNVDLDGDTSITDVVASINAATSNARILGDVTTYTATLNDKVKVTVDGTDYNDINIGGEASLADAASVIDTAITAKGICSIVGGYMEIISKSNGASSSVVIADGSGTAQTVIAKLFTTVPIRSNTGNVSFATNGLAVVDSLGYLRIYRKTRGAANAAHVKVSDGALDDQEATEILFDGTSSESEAIVADLAPSGKYCTTWSDRCWIANTSANPDRLYYSSSADHTTWSALDYNDIITPGDVGITGMRVLRGRLYVFKRYSVHRVTYLGGTPLLSIAEVRSWMGTASPRTIQNIDIPGEGEMIIYLGTDYQLYKFDGYASTPISEVISTYNGISSYCMIGDGSTYGINPSTTTSCHAVHYSTRHWYILFFCKDDDTSPKDAIVFDYFANSFWPFHIDEDGSDVFTASCLGDNGAGQKRMYVGGYNGATYHLWLFDDTYADDGGDIDAYWVSSKLDLGSEVTKKQMRNITLSTSSNIATPTFQYRCDWETDYSTAETLTASTRTHTYDLPRFEELIQFKVSEDSATAATFSLIRASIIASVEGQAK